MTFPTGTTISTANVSSDTNNPASARVDILAAIQALNAIIASANQASGVLVLTGSGLIPSATLPSQITLPAGVQVINPVSGIVNIRDVLRLQQMSTTDILALEDSVAGDIAFATDGDSTAPALCIYDGTDWRTLNLSSLGFLE